MSIQDVKIGAQKKIGGPLPPRAFEFLSAFAVVLGFVLRLRQYLVNRSLWVDEASLALNIIHRTFGALTTPLDYNQGAPLGFLFIEKLATLILGSAEYSLRLFPLFAGFLSVYLMYQISREQIGSSGWVAVLIISISSPLIYYSSELKQYSSDVMFSLLLVYLATICLSTNMRMRNIILLGVSGVVSIWTSHPSVFVLAGIGLALVIEILRTKNYSQFMPVFGMGIVWSLTLGVSYLVSLQYLTGNNYLKEYWISHFMPLPTWGNLEWYKDTYASLLANVNPSFVGSFFIQACFILILVGVISFTYRKRQIALLIILPFLGVAMASALQKYPLSGRFMLFLAPFVILLITEGLNRIYSILYNWKPALASPVYALMILLLLWSPGYYTLQNTVEPYMGEDIKPVMAYVQANMQNSDIVYVFSGSVNPFRYYAPSYGLDLDTAIVAEKSNGVKGFLEDVNSLKGKGRVWFLFSHVIGCGGCEGDKVQFYVRTLDEYGAQLDSFQASGASVFLYDLRP